MVNLATVLSVSFLEDAVCADAGLRASACWEREERAGPQHRLLTTSDRLCIRVWGVGTPEHPHWMGTSDRTGTAYLPPLVIQHSRLTLCTSRWWPGWAGVGSQRESWECGGEAQEPKPALQTVWVLVRRCHLRGAFGAAPLCQRRFPPRGCWGAHECR